MVALNLISINARGLNTPHEGTIILEFLRKKNMHFATIQESHLMHKDAGRMANKFYHPIATSSATTKYKGVMVLCKCNLKFNLIGSWADDAGRIAIAKICMEGKNIAFISAYAPNTYDAAFYDMVTKSMLDLAGFHLVLDFSIYSGRHKTFSQLDFIFASKDLFRNVQNAYYVPVAWSDHKPIYFKIILKRQWCPLAGTSHNTPISKTSTGFVSRLSVSAAAHL
uniref:Endonuclease/exonuclease/phosphatase domain-containing protein n=1 Tax=Kryptolebias marmoratus TaxID=37003 RepID=A0A3Q3AK35_KRYMA